MGSETGAGPPKPRIDKLGVKIGMRVAILGLRDPDFDREAQASGAVISRRRPVRDADLVFFAASRAEDLYTLETLRSGLVPNGALWVLWLKGRRGFGGNHVREAALAVGLVDVKIVAFSETLSALKLVIPLAQRNAHGFAKRRANR